MQQRQYLEDVEKLMEQIHKGAFLTVAGNGAVNTMTIGWATIGFIWQRPIFMVAVRDSRHTYNLLEKADNFTVSIPADDSSHQALMVCGTKSGRDIDKLKEAGLATRTAQQVKSPIIDIPGVHYECRIVYQSAMNPAFLNADLERLYPKKDYHTLYFGEILANYSTE